MRWIIIPFFAMACGSADAEVSREARSTPPIAMMRVPFEMGLVDGSKGDTLSVDEVVGTRAAFVAGGEYRVRGHYHLESLPEASLAIDLRNGASDEHNLNSTFVYRGDGTFDLSLRILSPGYPHVALHPKGSSEAVATAYFGTGASVYRQDR